MSATMALSGFEQMRKLACELFGGEYRPLTEEEHAHQVADGAMMEDLMLSAGIPSDLASRLEQWRPTHGEDPDFKNMEQFYNNVATIHPKDPNPCDT